MDERAEKCGEEAAPWAASSRASDSSAPEVSFVIPSFESARTLGGCLQSILHQQTNRKLEILVIHSSPDAPVTETGLSDPRLRILRSKDRLFPGAARNLGAGEARGRLLAFVDADVRPESLWLETLAALIDECPGMCLAGAAVANGNPQSLASQILYWIEFSEFLPGRPSGRRSHLSSSNLLMRRRDFLESGGFSSSLAMYEDMLFCRQLKGELYFTSSTHVLHDHRTTRDAVHHHLRSLGYWSGYCRHLYRLKGTALGKGGAPALALAAYRTLRVWGRIMGTKGEQHLRATIALPTLFSALFTWSQGFAKGVQDGRDLMHNLGSGGN